MKPLPTLPLHKPRPPPVLNDLDLRLGPLQPQRPVLLRQPLVGEPKSANPTKLLHHPDIRVFVGPRLRCEAWARVRAFLATRPGRAPLRSSTRTAAALLSSLTSATLNCPGPQASTTSLARAATPGLRMSMSARKCPGRRHVTSRNFSFLLTTSSSTLPPLLSPSTHLPSTIS